MQTIDKFIAPRQIGSHLCHSCRKIPLKIYQTFETNVLCDGMYKAALTWINNNTNYQYEFMDNNDRINFIKECFDSRIAKAYNLIPHGAAKADLWRYCILYVNGGIYADIDTIFLSSLDSFIDIDDDFITVSTIKQSHRVFNGFLCSSPRHPFLKCAIERATDLVLSGKPFQTMDFTGPGNLGKAMNICIGRDEKAVHRPGINRTEFGRIKILEKRAANINCSSSHVVFDDRVILVCKYAEYKDELRKSGIRHWKNKKILEEILEEPYKKMTRKLRKVFLRLKNSISSIPPDK